MPFQKLKEINVPKRFQKDNKSNRKSSPEPVSNTKSDVIVKFGKPVIQITFKRIKLFVALFLLLLITLILISFDSLITAIRIRNHLGSFINMISSGDGEVLPSLLALPVFVFLCLNAAIFVFVYRIFAKKRRPRANRILFILLLVTLLMVLVTLVVIFITLGHIYGSHKKLEDGIVKAMEKYAVNSFYKKQIDKLQIEFQCCGSKNYDDWYNISWLQNDLSTNSSTSQNGNTPFSCCAIKTKFPCIHFDIDCTGVNYLYTPEYNLSISATGCHKKIVEKKQQIGVGIVGSLFLYVFFELLMLIPARFLQTSHSVNYRFEGNNKTYTAWLLGSYTGRNQSNGPPEPPPVPLELMD